MSDGELELCWHGPFVLVPQSGFECVFDQSVAGLHGVYLWTVEHRGGYLINYVGETGQSFAGRLADGVRWDLGGQAKGCSRTTGMICEPEQFRQGKMVPIAQRFTIKEFLTDYPRLSGAMYRNYCCYSYSAIVGTFQWFSSYCHHSSQVLARGRAC